MPFWSSHSRAERIIATVSAYSGFVTEEIDWASFTSKWAPDLERDGCLIGINWSGANATGYDLPASHVIGNVEALTVREPARKAESWLARLLGR
jgi:hypothetical protein